MAFLNISPLDFWNSTPIETYYALEAYNNNKKEENKLKLEYIRLQTFYLINSQRTKEEQILWDNFMNPDKANENITPPDWNKIDNEGIH